MQKRVKRRIEYSSPAILREMVNSYFDECDALDVPYTVSGLCLSVGYSRERLLTTSADNELGDVISQAKLLIEQQIEYRLSKDDKPQGLVFALKNMGWTDRQQLDLGAPALQDGSQTKYTIEVVKPDGKKENAEVPDTGKVTSLFEHKKAV